MKSTNTESEKIAYRVSNILVDLGCIVFRPHQPFKYNTGIISPVYTDNRLILSSPKDRDKIVSLLVKTVRKIGVPDVIAGTSTAGIPHAAFIAQKLGIPMIYVRPKPKEYGRENQVEGSLKRGKKVIVVDDLISTGHSSIEAAKAVRRAGGKVTSIIAITSYGLKEADENFKKSKIKLYSLTDINYSMETAVKKGFLKKERVEMIKDWAKDPKGWGKKMGFE